MHACANNEVRAQRRIRRGEATTAGGAGAAARPRRRAGREAGAGDQDVGG